MGAQQDVVVGSSLIGEGQTESESDGCCIGIEKWNRAEKAAEGIISNFQPTLVSEKKRDAVIVYLQKLLKDKLDCEVFAYGSVPLKTYLPDGDIDLSVVGARTRSLIKEIASLLESEEKNSSAEFVVKDVQLIGAQVKLVKCMVENLVVDISVNQIGGLCTLCFLEQVDRVIKKDHLFKRSIILIKAWCYYESRTLGAHVGLISTYGLETLVLYIFHVFHITIDGPLSVLYKFLEYFSTFDWENYGISLMGPVRLSELPRIIVERPPNSDDLLLKVGFLRRCSETLSIPMRHGDVFSKKHLNIVDPLNINNNLGRSVSQGSGYPGNQISSDEKDVSTLKLSGAGEVTDRVSIPFYAPHLFSQYSKLANKTDDGDHDINDVKQSEVHEEEELSAFEEVLPSEPLDLTGDLMSHLIFLDHVRGWDNYIFAPPGMMGPPPPPPLVLLSLIASDHGGINGFHHPQFHPSGQMFMSRPPFIPNDPSPTGPVNHFLDMNRSGQSYHTSTSSNRAPNPNNLIPRPKGVNGPMPQREPLLHRRQRNPNRSRQLEGSQRPRSVSGMDRYRKCIISLKKRSFQLYCYVSCTLFSERTTHD